MQDHKLFWGDSHANLHLGHPKWPVPLLEYDDSSGDRFTRSLAELEAALAHARGVIDF